ncbi:XRE family transcriptional regulator [Pseudomonas putida]|uniref:helix-turn-helix domain-containing protein n=1 Tax=Pseudomonas putida TaxID=303 RepID=UPI00300E89AF
MQIGEVSLPIEGVGSDSSIERAALGAEIRRLRKARSKTLAELALATGRSISFISQLERGRTEISISDMKRVAHALSVPLGWFFVSTNQPAVEVGRVVRADGRRRLGSVTDGLTEELLSPHIGGKFEMFLSTFGPGATLERPTVRHTEEEGYLISGELDIWIGNNHFQLTAGDSFRIVGEPFRWENRSEADAIVSWVIAPPAY